MVAFPCIVVRVPLIFLEKELAEENIPIEVFDTQDAFFCLIP